MKEIFEELKHDAVALLQRLVQIPSVTGDESEVQTVLASHLKRMGLEVDSWRPLRAELESHPAFSDDGLPLGERPVIVARWRGTDPSMRSLILNGHVDVVPVGEESAWDGGPWSGRLQNERVYGRGSCDMKGGLVSGITAIAALQRQNIARRGDVLLEFVIGEETGGVGTLSSVIRGYRADAAVILEPTRLAICPVGAGAASFRLRVPGRAAHGAMRMEGVSAVEKFFVLHQALLKLEQERHQDFQNPAYAAGDLVAPLSIGKVTAGDWPSTVPDLLIAEGRFGVLPGENIRQARSDFEHAIGAAAARDPWLREHSPTVEWFEGQFEPGKTSHDAPIVLELKRAHAHVMGAAPAVHGVPYGSDLRFFTNHANMDAVLYGPGDVRMAHSVNEFVPVEEVMRAAEVIATLLQQWWSPGSDEENHRVTESQR